jgi:hypothetical protein
MLVSPDELDELPDVDAAAVVDAAPEPDAVVPLVDAVSDELPQPASKPAPIAAVSAIAALLLNLVIILPPLIILYSM